AKQKSALRALFLIYYSSCRCAYCILYDCYTISHYGLSSFSWQTHIWRFYCYFCSFNFL
ncbi:hypothetical protein, partial [Bacillus altitudinis]